MTKVDATRLRSERVQVDSYEHLLTVLEERRWGDGLPVVPATAERVCEFVEASGRDPAESLGMMAPAWADATIEKVAVNAVMAGCRPEYMPLIVTATEVMLEPAFNILAVQATTHPAAPLALVSGSLARRLEVNGGAGAFGPGWRANATIGRAIRLILLNIGGGVPGTGDHSTQGGPAKYSYCVSENDEETPWEPFRVARGFAAEDSVVFMAALEAPHNINDHGSTSGLEILTTIAGTMAEAGCNNLYLEDSDPYLFLGPEHAHHIAADGFSRREVQAYLFEHARVPLARIGAGQQETLRKRHRMLANYRELGLDDPNLPAIPLFAGPEDLNIVVVGGAGKHSSWVPSFGLIRSIGRRIPAAG